MKSYKMYKNDLIQEHEINSSGFKILPHVETKMINTGEHCILDYHYQRYRYDIFPSIDVS